MLNLLRPQTMPFCTRFRGTDQGEGVTTTFRMGKHIFGSHYAVFVTTLLRLMLHGVKRSCYRMVINCEHIIRSKRALLCGHSRAVKVTLQCKADAKSARTTTWLKHKMKFFAGERRATICLGKRALGSSNMQMVKIGQVFRINRGVT